MNAATYLTLAVVTALALVNGYGWMGAREQVKRIRAQWASDVASLQSDAAAALEHLRRRQA